MVGNLLVRGMMAGLLAGFLSFGFLRVAGEPAVDRAIAFETAMDAARQKAAAAEAVAKGAPVPTAEADPELVSRPTQAGIGLWTGVTIYNVAFGGLFALVFAMAFGRVGILGEQETAAWLALVGFVAVYLVPNLKYPANPPSIGDPDTIGMRTGLYFAMIAISLATMIAADKVRLALLGRLGGFDAALVATLAYVAVLVAVALALPVVNEVPDGFPAIVLWQFRLASLGAQAIMWTTLGLGFGLLQTTANAKSARRLVRAD